LGGFEDCGEYFGLLGSGFIGVGVYICGLAAALRLAELGRIEAGMGGESKGKGRGGSRDIEEGAAAGGITEVPTGRGEGGAM